MKSQTGFHSAVSKARMGCTQKMPRAGRPGCSRLIAGALFAGVGLAAFTSAATWATTVDSLNWAGYADVAGSGQTFSNVSGEWAVPTVSGTRHGGSTYAAFWVGLDGYNSSTSPTVEQIGIGAQTSGKSVSYYAWYEMYPSLAYAIPLTVQPGNVISAAVSYIGNNQYQLSIANLSLGQQYSTDQSLASGQRSSAEWIAEAPSSASTGGVLPLANFGSVTFSGASATLNGVSGAINAFNDVAINMVSSSGTLEATTSALLNGGTSFTVTTGSSTPIIKHGHHSSLIGAPVAPEPSTLLLAGAGIAALTLTHRRKSKVSA